MALSNDQLFEIVRDRLERSREAQAFVPQSALTRRQAWVHSLVAICAIAAMTQRVMAYSHPLQ